MNTAAVGARINDAVNQNTALSTEGLLERAFGALFRGLVYAQIWEDPVSDMGALDLTPDDHIICIASGGCNMMSYLTASPASITAVDLSPSHVMLNRLKLASARHLPDASSFYNMFGHANRVSNIALFDEKIAPHLSVEERVFWNTRAPIYPRKTMFARGLYRFGALGHFISAVHAIAWLARIDFSPLLAARTLEDQQAYFDAEIAPLFERPLLRFLIRRRASLFGLGIPPAQYDKLAADADGDIVAVLKERTRKLLCDFPVSENYFAWQAAGRGYKSDGTGPVPPYLEAQNFDVVQANADRVTVVNAAMTETLANMPAHSKSVYILLDAQDWMNDEQLTALWREITRTAMQGARVLFRTGGSPDILPGRVPNQILSRWTYDLDASAKALAADRSAIYGGVHVYRLSGT